MCSFVQIDFSVFLFFFFQYGGGFWKFWKFLNSFTLMGNNKKVLIMDLFSFYFTLQHLGWKYFS